MNIIDKRQWERFRQSAASPAKDASKRASVPPRNQRAPVALIRQKYNYSALNCLFSDGVKFFAYRDYAREPDYYSLYKACSDNSWLISSEPLDAAIRWQMMAQEEFLAIEL